MYKRDIVFQMKLLRQYLLLCTLIASLDAAERFSFHQGNSVRFCIRTATKCILVKLLSIIIISEYREFDRKESYRFLSKFLNLIPYEIPLTR